MTSRVSESGSGGRLRDFQPDIRTTLADMREARLLLSTWEDMVLKPGLPYLLLCWFTSTLVSSECVM